MTRSASFDDNRRDIHYLLCTDTWLGEQAASIIKDWLQNQGMTVELLRHRDLQTNNLAEFQTAMSELVKDCDEVLRGYRESGYHIVFNLTGGFKSVQGFLQTLGMFYADESIYIFESGKELLHLPRLPVRLDLVDTIQKSLSLFRRLAAGLPVKIQDCEDIPETLIFMVGSDAALSAWGELVWRQTYREIYGIKLFPPPSSRIYFSESFEKSVSALPKERKIIINERIDQLARFIELGNNQKSLHYQPIYDKEKLPSTHEFYAWSDQGARRIFCHTDVKQNIVVLDELGQHLR